MKILLPRLMKIAIAVVLMVSMLPIFPQKASASAYDPGRGYQTLEVRFWEDEAPPIGFYINASARYILETVTQPSMGSTFGEWSVMDLLRAKHTGYDYINYIPPTYFEDYLKRIDQYVTQKNGVLDRNKSTEWSRLTLAMSALGRDIRNIAGYDFVNELSKSYGFSYRQGINGPIWEIIALDTGGYELYTNPTNQKAGDVTNTVGLMIDYILAREITQRTGELGGWALSGSTPDPDITGMALQAFAPYYLDSSRYAKTGAKASYNEFAKAVERGVLTLANIQDENGGYKSWGTSNSESIVQVIVALTALDMDPLASSISLPHINEKVDFITDGGTHNGVWTNNTIDALLLFWAAGSGSSPEVGGFKHVTSGYDGGGGSGVTVNAMATDQALYGLIAYDRFLKNKNRLYDMTDMINGEHREMQASTEKVTLDGNAITETSSLQKSPYALVTVPTKPDVYSWNTKKDGSGTKYLPGEQLVVPEHSITLYAQSEITSAMENEAKIQAVIKMIDELPSVQALTRDHLNVVNFATSAYNKLTAEEKQLVTNHSTLALIEGKIQQIVAQYDDELRVTNLIKTIDDLSAIQPLTEDYEIAVHNARVTYNGLTAAQRMQITNISKLEILEAKMAILIDIAQQEHQAAIDAADTNNPLVGSNDVESVIALIQQLPALNKVTLNDLIDVRKARIFVDSIPLSQQSSITNLSTLKALEDKLDQLAQAVLEKEDFEDDVNEAINKGDDDANQSSTTTVAEVSIKGKEMIIEANKASGNFDISLDKEVLDTIQQYNLNEVELKDARNVQIAIDANELLANVKTIKNVAATQIYVSQYDYETGLFEVKLKAIDQNGKAHQLKMDKSYVNITLPYNFFVNGLRLQESIVMKVEGDKEIAVAHVSNGNTLTLKLKSDGVYKFTKKEVAFSDITTLKGKDDILYLAARGIIDSSQKNYNPQNKISRAQFARMITRALGIEAKASKSVFKDVQGKDYELAVQALYEAGIVTNSDGKFNPSADISRKQAALMMARVLRYTGFDTTAIKATSNFKDVGMLSKQELEDIQMLNTLGIMTGNEKKQFMPQNKLTRAQMAKILKNTLNISQMM